jgi:hypothetical protein
MPDLPPNKSTEERRKERLRLKQKYGELYSATEALFFRHDPIGINFEDNTDEYDPEVSSVLPRLRTCDSEADVQRVLHEEFTRWFGDAGPLDLYAPIATDLWRLWNEFNTSNRKA